tara:strand:- start:9363 stop:11891 length:2529 start_codon:yes stop_codon:yes gene_type:complete
MRRLVLLLSFTLFSALGYSQCTTNFLDLGPDTTVCLGEYHLFSAPYGLVSYSWSTGGVTRYLSTNVPGTYTCTVGIADTANLVTNGDFSSGNTGFTSSYVYGTGGSWGLLSNPGQYAVSTNANLTHNNFPSCTDHTSGTGNYMIMNGSSVANTNVWCQTITVLPNTSYIFSGWFTSVDPASPAQLNFTVGGVAVGSVFNLSASTCSWTKYSRSWTSGATQTSATICIRSQSIASGGNDFAVDDIMFTKMCTSTDTVVLSADTMPIANLGSDTVICGGNSYVLDATDNPLFDYQWSNGTAVATSTITSTDSNLMVTVTNGHCEAIDTVIVTVSSQPIIDLGADTTLCPGNNFDLAVSWPGAAYLWSDNSVGNTLNVSSAGQYWVRVTDNCGVTYDTINVSYVVYPLVDLGNDTTICDGETISLNAGYPNATYGWNTGSTDSVINVTQTGPYSVLVQVGNCVDRDTVQVTVDPFPTVNLGQDTTLCTGQSLLLDVTNSGATYLWNDGAATATKSVTTAGTFWANVSIGNCASSDTVVVDYMDYPVVDLGNDTIVCQGDVVVYDVSQPNVSYLWNNNSTGSSLSVTQRTKVWVEISNFCGVVSDTVNVFFNAYPTVDLGGDTAICEGESFSKDVTNPGAVYVWNDGSSAATRIFSSAGVYAVTVTSKQCASVDTLNLQVHAVPVVYLGEDTVICNKAKMKLTIPNTYDSVLWSDGTTENQIVIEEADVYWVEVTNAICKSSDSILVAKENCEVYVEMPNIFTPNGDGVNDLFLPVYSLGIAEIQTKIFDRWGKLVFETTTVDIKWDGNNTKGVQVPDGVYYWIVNIVGFDTKNYEQKGNVTLLRQ